MKTINRKNLSLAVCQRTGLALVDVSEVVNQTIAAMVDSIKGGDVILLHGLGTFEFRLRAKNVKRNPRKPEDLVDVPSHFAVLFRPAESLRIAVRKLPPEKITATRNTYASHKILAKR